MGSQKPGLAAQVGDDNGAHGAAPRAAFLMGGVVMVLLAAGGGVYVYCVKRRGRGASSAAPSMASTTASMLAAPSCYNMELNAAALAAQQTQTASQTPPAAGNAV